MTPQVLPEPAAGTPAANTPRPSRAARQMRAVTRSERRPPRPRLSSSSRHSSCRAASPSRYFLRSALRPARLAAADRSNVPRSTVCTRTTPLGARGSRRSRVMRSGRRNAGGSKRRAGSKPFMRRIGSRAWAATSRKSRRSGAKQRRRLKATISTRSRRPPLAAEAPDRLAATMEGRTTILVGKSTQIPQNPRNPGAGLASSGSGRRPRPSGRSRNQPARRLSWFAPS